ncbi:MAG: hypothetical protein COW55_13100 [Rhodobacteraceae bacterium CG17_big_fil_post_rev_8_21_14_2_50_65_11]|nr:MAG: hypothetical protein COW55_13100 [Rhodobacteraceae bacterium CG17_big_fil_post_rev_8_21_14_2_50_65_11]
MTAFDQDKTHDGVLALRVGRLAGWVWSISGLIVAAGLLADLVFLADPRDRFVLLAMELFNPDREMNIFAWYNTALLLVNALLLLLAARVWRDSDPIIARGLHLLGWVFVLLSLDEMVSAHERIGRELSHFLAGEQIVFAWIVPGTVFVLAVAAVVVPMLRRLPSRLFRQMLLAGAIFVGGAVGLEGLGWYVTHVDGGWTFRFLMLTWVEESLEVAGLSVFLVALSRTIAAPGQSLRVID